MGTTITISIVTEKNPTKDIENSFEIFSMYEKIFSRFDEKSELSILNKDKKLTASLEFLNMLNLVKRINSKTNNYFNPLINLNKIGYSKDFEKKQFLKQENNLEDNLNLDEIIIKDSEIYLKENQNLDFGGIVKGYSVDQVKNYLERNGYRNFIINAGGDIYLSGKTSDNETPVIGIANPFNLDEDIAVFEITNLSVSTSGIYKRKWEIEKEKYHHILNPLENKNLSEILSITIISEKCYLSDAYATSCIAMGIEKSINFLNENNIDYLIITEDKKIITSKDFSKYNLEIL